MRLKKYWKLLKVANKERSGTEGFRCGYVAIIGRPNVGKSTLLNHILSQKISITSNKPQTTRHTILGVKTTQKNQTVYVDTPGLHQGSGRAMNRYMNRSASAVITDVDVVVFIVECFGWTQEDEYVLKMLRDSKVPVILAINKVDKLNAKEALLPYIQDVSSKMNFADVIPLSARKGTNTEALEKKINGSLPLSDPFFPEDQVTDRSERFLAAELVREKLMRRLGQEIPYSLTVEIESFKMQKKVQHIHAVIWVEREGQKRIVIGQGGIDLKMAGQQARKEMEALFDRKVFLQLWVKVREGWADDERALRSLGYGE